MNYSSRTWRATPADRPVPCDRSRPYILSRHGIGAATGMFQMFVGYACVLSVAVLYYAWRDGYAARTQRRANVNERVAYLLWVAAQRAG